MSMSTEAQSYFETIKGCLERILLEAELFERCGKICSEAIKRDRLIHVIGPGGHSNMAAEEVLWRAGGLAAFNPILDPGTNIAHGAVRSNIVERTPGYARAVFDAYELGGAGEVIIIVNAYGINSMCVESAQLARERGMTSIAVTSPDFSERVPRDHPARHPSGKNLNALVDLVIDNHLPAGDAAVQVEGVESLIAPTSTYVNCFCVNLIAIETVKALRRAGCEPPIWISANVSGGEENNRNLVKRYGGRVKHLV